MNKRQKAGFTLLEVLVAMGILMMIVLMMSTLFHQSNMAWQNGMRQAEMSIQARSTLSLMRRDLSQAVAASEYPCDFGGGGFTVYVMDTADGSTRSIKKVQYSGSISRKITDYDSSDGGVYTVGGQSQGSAELLDAETFAVTASDWSSTNLPAWVDISITLSKTASGAAGIKVWSLGRKNSDSQKRIKKAKKNKLHTGDEDSIPW